MRFSLIASVGCLNRVCDCCDVSNFTFSSLAMIRLKLIRDLIQRLYSARKPPLARHHIFNVEETIYSDLRICVYPQRSLR